MKRNIKLILAAVAVLALAGCGTIAGIGSDLQRMSDWTQEKLDGGFQR